MEEIKITETETLMSDGSTHVHCEAEHDGQRIVTTYNISAQCVDKVAFRRTATPAMIHAAIDALRIVIPEQTDAARAARVLEGVTVSFNPRTCDPAGEGEELAKAITDAVADKDDGAIGALLQAAECLGAWILRLDDAPRGEIVDKLYENDAWREHLKIAIAEAEAQIAQDANPDPGINAEIVGAPSNADSFFANGKPTE